MINYRDTKGVRLKGFILFIVIITLNVQAGCKVYISPESDTGIVSHALDKVSEIEQTYQPNEATIKISKKSISRYEDDLLGRLNEIIYDSYEVYRNNQLIQSTQPVDSQDFHYENLSQSLSLAIEEVCQQ